MAPIADPEWVIAVVLEDGGGGGTSAAPVGRQIFQYLFGETVDPIGAGF
jgi:penicillin-binding protein 2